MVTYRQLGKNGRLGNQLFQFAAAYSHAKNLGVDCGFIDIPFEKALAKPLPVKRIFDSYPTGVFYSEPKFSYREIPKIKNLDLFGYYQSEKYFHKYTEEIRELLKPNEVLSSYVKTNYKENSCSIHVRRGDYLNYPDIHPVVTAEYIMKAVSYVGKDKFFFVFSDDIQWCKNHLSEIKNIVFISGTELEDFFLQSALDNHIICNSSFSWWAAWLNENKTKKIVAPTNWFGPLGPPDTGDLIPERWVTL
jgi:hypothetical protein